MTAWWRRGRGAVDAEALVRAHPVTIELGRDEWALVRKAVAASVRTDQVVIGEPVEILAWPTYVSRGAARPVIQVQVVIPWDVAAKLVSSAVSSAERGVPDGLGSAT